ncbi:hypothetical protein V6615_13460 [Oscillospiraceae bacterium PP1C4]
MAQTHESNRVVKKNYSSPIVQTETGDYFSSKTSMEYNPLLTFNPHFNSNTQSYESTSLDVDLRILEVSMNTSLDEITVSGSIPWKQKTYGFAVGLDAQWRLISEVSATLLIDDLTTETMYSRSYMDVRPILAVAAGLAAPQSFTSPFPLPSPAFAH